jgi:hypothetical protein
LLLNDGENGAGRIASLKLGGEWMCNEITFCMLFVYLKGVIQD